MRAAGLTKKAVLYYEEAGLVDPRVEENGYRDYTSADVERLSRVAVLRRCGLSVAEIQSALDSGDLAECARRKRTPPSCCKIAAYIRGTLGFHPKPRKGDYPPAPRYWGFAPKDIKFVGFSLL